MTNEFEASRAKLSDKDLFKRFLVKEHDSLKELVFKGKLDIKEELLVIERNGERLAFSVKQMAYHHVAQGNLAGQPYLVNF